MQYSYLPSWLSYLVDQRKAREAGRDLFDAVYGKWLKLPPDARPNLYVGGESLGSFGAESAFSGAYDLSNRTAGALFVGPPNFTPCSESSATTGTQAALSRCLSTRVDASSDSPTTHALTFRRTATPGMERECFT